MDECDTSGAEGKIDLEEQSLGDDGFNNRVLMLCEYVQYCEDIVCVVKEERLAEIDGGLGGESLSRDPGSGSTYHDLDVPSQEQVSPRSRIHRGNSTPSGQLLLDGAHISSELRREMAPCDNNKDGCSEFL